MTAATRAYVERLVGRPLRPSETAVDVVALDAAMNQAKDDVHRAIRAEQRRAVRRAQPHRAVELDVTAAMVAPLDRLYRLGRREAVAELERHGYSPVRRYADAAPDNSALDALVQHKLRDRLDLLQARITNERLTLDLGAITSAEIAAALMRVPGALDLASRVVSTALYSGMGQTFEENQDLVTGWEWSAVMDSGTCDPCEAGDGTEYASWDEAQDDLPNGGPAVVCDGGDRCRCRLVPQPA